MRNCFVCMPLIDEYKSIYDNAILPEVKDAPGGPWNCAKADDQRQPGMVTEKVVSHILNADLIIAVAADPRQGNTINPNVMYELGIAHSFRKPTLVIADINNGLPFDLHALETIQVNFDRYKDESQQAEFLFELRRTLRVSLKSPVILDDFERKRIPRNPVTTQLSGSHIFIEDLPWLMGYCEVLKREREAKTIWEITRDLFWPGEPLFFENLRTSLRDDKKHYFLIPDEEGVIRKADAIKNELREYLPPHEIERNLRFVAIETKYFALWPIAVVLYDADLARGRGGVICEPMEGLVGQDSYDDFIRELFAQYSRNGDWEGFQQHLGGLDWIRRRQESTFDVRLDGRVVDALATSFARIWNERIREEARQKTNEKEQTTLLDNWLIKG